MNKLLDTYFEILDKIKFRYKDVTPKSQRLSGQSDEAGIMISMHERGMLVFPYSTMAADDVPRFIEWLSEMYLDAEEEDKE